MKSSARRFVNIAGQPFQVIGSTTTFHLPIVDLQDLPESQREAQVRRLAQTEVQQPFDLAQGPLLRATLVRLADVEHVLLLTMHHIVSDGWSHGVFWRELAVLYERFYDWTAIATPCTLDTVCGFCPLAAAVAAGRGAGHAA